MNDKEKFLLDIYSEKVKHMTECYRVYYSTLAIIGSGFIVGVGFMLKADTSSPLFNVVTCLTPLFTAAWAAAFIFCYWDNHTIRLNVEFIERLIGEKTGLEFYPTWFGDFLGIFESAKILKIRVVVPLFLVIGIFPMCLYLSTAFHAISSGIINGPVLSAYKTILVLMPLVVFSIHVFCVMRERKIIKKIYDKAGMELRK
jgi:hypothetical protein